MGWGAGDFGRACRSLSAITWSIIAVCVACVFILICAGITVPVLRANAVRELKVKTVTVPLNRVRSGAVRVVVHDLELLDKLASDSICIENLVEIRFSGVAFETKDAVSLSQLVGLQTISFYDCDCVDLALQGIANLGVGSIHLELVQVSAEALSKLSSYGGLRKIEFEQVPTPDQRKALEGLPSGVLSTSRQGLNLLHSVDEST